MKGVLIVAPIVCVLSACAPRVDTAEGAKHVADVAIEDYCKSSQDNDCSELEYFGLNNSDLGYLVEYRSGLYMHAVLVKEDGSIEFSRFKEEPGN